MRADRVFSIDPESAKDIDDALSIKKNENGTYDIGVHIADVSHFVKPNTALDRDARKRATSVYLVQRAVPMLPPTLSEQLCSLQPGEDRLAFSVIFTMTEDSRVLKKWFGKTIIRCVFFAYHVYFSYLSFVQVCCQAVVQLCAERHRWQRSRECLCCLRT
jgi:protein SSD1